MCLFKVMLLHKLFVLSFYLLKVMYYLIIVYYNFDTHVSLKVRCELQDKSIINDIKR